MEEKKLLEKLWIGGRKLKSQPNRDLNTIFTTTSMLWLNHKIKNWLQVMNFTKI